MPPPTTGENFDKKDQVLIGGLNVNGLRNKSEAIKSLILSYQFDIFVITETKFTSNGRAEEDELDELEDKYKLEDHGYMHFKFDRPRVAPEDNQNEGAGGGILIYSRKELGIPNLNLRHHEPRSDIQILHLSFNNLAALDLIAVYHPPKANQIPFNMQEETPPLDVLLENRVFNNIGNNGRVVLIGDTNLQTSIGDQRQIIKKIEDSGRVSQIIDVFTRVEVRRQIVKVYKISRSLIDHIYVGEQLLNNIISSGVLRFGMSDHDLIYCNIRAEEFNPPRAHQKKSVAVREIEEAKQFFMHHYKCCQTHNRSAYYSEESQELIDAWVNLVAFTEIVRDRRKAYCDANLNDECRTDMECCQENDHQTLISLHTVGADPVCAPCYIRS